MKAFWALGCCTSAALEVLRAVSGEGLFGSDWWGRGVNIVTASMFILAAVFAVRAKVPWFVWGDK